jgi:hypothetical protein
MSPVERRDSQQRTLAVAACAAAVVVGAPVVGHRFEVQKSAEAYQADAAELAASLNGGDGGWRQVAARSIAPEQDEAGVRLASFTNSLSGAPSGAATSRADWLAAGSAGLGQAALTARGHLAANTFAGLERVAGRARDSVSLTSLGAFSGESLSRAEETRSELDCLAEAVYYEARSEGTRGQLAVAEVVMNRVRDSRYPNTVCEVVFQGQYRQTGCQFTFTCDGSRRIKPRGVAWDRAKAVALHVSLGLNKPVTNKATHYHTDYVNPYWRAGMVETTVIGTHIFYRFPKTGAEWAQARLALDAQQQHNAALSALEGDAAPVVEADAVEAAPNVIALTAPAAAPPPAASPL